MFTYRWHGQVALEAPPHPIIDTLGLPPCWGDALEPIALVPSEALRAYNITPPSISSIVNVVGPLGGAGKGVMG